MEIKYPKDFEKNLQYRSWIDDECRKDIKFAQIVKEACAKDVLFFVNTFLFAEDPFAEKGKRHGMSKVRLRPIITYTFQDEFILDLEDAIDTGQDFIADKSRDMLATYMVLAVFFHRWLFSGQKFMIASWKEDEIDGREDTSTHFGKLRLYLKYLPPYLRPKGWDFKKNNSYMSIRNPENGGTITGSAASENLASGRREDAIFYDELSKWQTTQKEAWVSGSDATYTKIGVWTPKGATNHAAMLMRGNEVKKKHHLMWYLHPQKTYTSAEHLEKVKMGTYYDKVGGYVVQIHEDQSKAPDGCYIDQNGKIRSEWYDEQCETRLKEDIAENLDCSYTQTGNPYFDTVICERRKYESKKPIAVGQLVWKVKPEFDNNKYCTNQDLLDVEFVKNMNGNVWLWEMPETGWSDPYIVSADTAEGLEQQDYDAARVIRRFPKQGEKLENFKPTAVATFHDRIKTHEYAEELVKLAIFFNRACIAIERNNHGHAVISEMFYFYNNLYYDDILTKGFPEKSERVGITTGRNKPIMLGNLSKYIFGDRQDSLYDDFDERFWSETLTFVNNDGKLEAQGKSNGEKCYDDLVMSTAIGLWVHQELPHSTRINLKPKYDGWRSSWNEPEAEQMIDNGSLTGGFL